MPAKASCEVKTRTVRQPQKNGDIYVIERRTQYDPVKRYNVVPALQNKPSENCNTE